MARHAWVVLLMLLVSAAIPVAAQEDALIRDGEVIIDEAATKETGSCVVHTNDPDLELIFSRLAPKECSLEIGRIAVQAGKLLSQEKTVAAIKLLRSALEVFPQSDSLRDDFVTALRYRYVDTNKAEVGRQLTEEAIKAIEMQIAGEGFFPYLHIMIEDSMEGLARAGDRKRLDSLFRRLIAYRDNHATWIAYLNALESLHAPDIESLYQEAVNLEARGIPAKDWGNFSALFSMYGEFLLDRGRNEDALSVLPESSGDDYVSFLRGVALERLGRLEEAEESYRKWPHGELIAVPERFRIPGSALQKRNKILFDSDKEEQGKIIGRRNAILGLAALIWAEAGGESVGGQRAVGWTVRDRVLRGSPTLPNSDKTCPTKPKEITSTTEFEDRYRAVICQGGKSGHWQFFGMRDKKKCTPWCTGNPLPFPAQCKFPENFETLAAAVFDGTAPDPVSGHCPGGVYVSGANWCDEKTKCYGGQWQYYLLGPVSFYSQRKEEACEKANSNHCGNSSGMKLCENGLPEHCFYYNSNWDGPLFQGVLEKSFLVLPQKGYFQLTAPQTTLAAHLEPGGGVDYLVNRLYVVLEMSTTGDPSRNGWELLGESAGGKDITYQAGPGVYRWRIEGRPGYAYNLWLKPRAAG